MVKPKMIQGKTFDQMIGDVLKKKDEAIKYVERTGKCFVCKKRKADPMTGRCKQCMKEEKDLLKEASKIPGLTRFSI